MAGGRGPHLGRAGDRNLIALLSLKLMLLAFFIVLTSMADPGVGRSDAVMDSVKRSFQGLLRSGDGNGAAGGDPIVGPLDGVRPLVERIGRIFQSRLSLSEDLETGGGQAVKLDVPLRNLLDGSGRQVTLEGQALLERLAAALDEAGADGRFHYEIDVLVRRSPDPETGNGLRLPARLAARLTRALASAGIPAERMAAGLAAAVPDEAVRLVLRFFESRPARLEFAPPGDDRGMGRGVAQ